MDAVAKVLADAVAGRTGRWLVLDGLWTRRETAWPPDGPWDGIGLRLPIGTEAARMVLHALAARLAPAGTLVVAGANDEGIRSAPSRLAEVFTEVSAARPGKHCRVIEARGPRTGVRGAIGDWATEVTAEVGGVPLRWWSWPGLFSHGRLDPGTRLLLEAMPDPAGLRVLDFASGAGPVSAWAVARGAARVDASDIDALAVHATALAAPSARVHRADGLPPGGPWDLIVTNPPLHAGRKTDRGPLQALLDTFPTRLAPGGRLVLVTHRTVPIGLPTRKLAEASPYVVLELPGRTGRRV